MWTWAIFALGATGLASSRTINHLIRRADDTCPDTFQTISGLNFDMHCGENQSGWDLHPTDDPTAITTQENSMTDCMNRCAAEHPLCHGAVFNHVDGTCWFKNETYRYSTDLGAGPSDDSHLAVARAQDLVGYDDACGFRNGSTQTNNGLNFTIHCGQDILGADYCPWANPALDCLFHAETLDECMGFCTKAQGLCEGVAWDANMTKGYQNCYPKFNLTQGFVPTGELPGNEGRVLMHSAVARIPTISVNCRNSQVLASDNGTGYTLSCDSNRPGNDLAAYHTNNLTDCINTCEQYSLGKCIGVVLDTTMADGFQNCYLKSGVGTPNTQQGYVLALQGGTPSSSTTTSSGSGPTGSPNGSGNDDDDDGGSKAWIAGAVVGPIAGLALIGALIWFLLRRRRRSQQAAAPLSDQQMQQHPSGAPGNAAYGPVDAKYRYSGGGPPNGGFHGHQLQTPVGELPGQQERAVQEMPTQKERPPVELPASVTER